MTNKPYSEQRQQILYEAARKMRAVAKQVLDDARDAEFTNAATVDWIKSVARKTATIATELENRGHEEYPATPRAEAANRRSHDAYRRSIDSFESRRDAALARVTS